MRTKAVLGEVLNRTLIKSDKQQKTLAIDSNTPRATVSDHFSGRPVQVAKAIEYAEAFEFDEGNDLTSQISWEYLGFVKSMDGLFADLKSANDLEVFKNIEVKEREELRMEAQILMANAQVRHLDVEELSSLKEYAFNIMDEIVVDLSIVYSVLGILRLSVQELIKQRMPEWQKKRYMKG